MTSGYTPVPCEHFAGLALDWPPEMVIPAGAPVAENVEITEAGVGRREGLSKVFDLAQPVAAMASLGPGTPAVALFGAGAFGAETEAGNGELSNRGNPATVPAPIRPAVIYGRVYIPNPDGSTGLATGLLPYYYDGTEANPVNPPLPTPNLAPGDSGTAGNIAAGLRYVICLLKMPDGSLMLCPGIGSWTAAGGHEALIGGLPTSFFETTPVAVILAFTVAGGSSAGPFFYIAEGQTVNGVVETSTVSEGDSAASITVNFDDSFLASSTDVTEYLRQIALPSEAAVAYSRLTDRLMWWGEQGQPSLLRLSEPGDAGLYLGDTGFVLVADEDGQSNRAAFEFRGGLYVAKDHSLYRVTPNNGDPATWNVSQVSASVGCCGPMAFADGGDFMLLLGRGGLHLFSGGATQWVSKMLNGADEDHPGIWERINWAEAWRFWVHIDHERKVARCGVALDGATSPSHILRFSYRDGWEGSLRYSAFTGRPHFWPGLRASVDTIAATGCWTIPRTAQLPQVPLDRRMAEIAPVR